MATWTLAMCTYIFKVSPPEYKTVYRMNFSSLLSHIYICFSFFFLTKVFCKLITSCDTENQKVLAEFKKSIDPLIAKSNELDACNEAVLLSDTTSSDYENCIFAIKLPEIANSSIFRIMSEYPYKDHITDTLYSMNFINFAIQNVCSQLKDNPKLSSPLVLSDADNIQNTRNNRKPSVSPSSRRPTSGQTNRSNNGEADNTSSKFVFQILIGLLCLFIILFLASVAYIFYTLKYKKSDPVVLKEKNYSKI